MKILEHENKTICEARSPEIRSSKFFALILLSIFIAALALRLFGITFDSLWLDESYQSMVGAYATRFEGLTEIPSAPYLLTFAPPGTVAEVLSNFRNVDPLCPPLHAILLNRWVHLFGGGDFALRAFSTLASMLFLGSLYLSCKGFLGRKTALIALLLAVISPYEIGYAQEARMYSLVLLFSTLSSMSLYFLLEKNRSIERPDAQKHELVILSGIYALSSFALFNTHYTGLYILAFQGAYSLYLVASTRRWTTLGFLIASWATMALFCLPWSEMFLQAAALKNTFYVTREPSLFYPIKGSLKLFTNWLSFLSGGRVTVYAAPLYASSAILIGTGMFIAARAMQRVGKAREGGTQNSASESSSSSSRFLAYLLAWALIPSLIALALDLAENRKTIEVSRYLIGTAPAIFMLAAAGFSALISRFRAAIWLLAIHALFAMVNYTYAHIQPQKEPWRHMASIVEQKVDINDLLVVSPHYDLVCLNRYLNIPRLQAGTGPMLGDAHMRQLFENRKRVWLLSAQEGSLVEVFVPASHRLAESIDLSHSLKLSRYEKN